MILFLLSWFMLFLLLCLWFSGILTSTLFYHFWISIAKYYVWFHLFFPENVYLTFFYCCSITVVSIFTPTQPPTPPLPTSHSQSYPLWLCPCVLYTYSLMDLLLFPPLSLFALPSDEVSTITVAYFTVMLSSSIHAVAKGRSSFFLSAV